MREVKVVGVMAGLAGGQDSGAGCISGVDSMVMLRLMNR